MTHSITHPGEVGPAGDMPADAIVAASRLARLGIYLMESIYLEDIARDQVHEFLFIAAPLKIAGATGSMIDPLAVI